MVAMLSTWRHSGFNVFCGNRIQPKEKEAMETLARYIIRASFSQERMQYFADEGTVVYSAKDGKDRKIFDAPEWLAAMCSHVPNRGEQMVRCLVITAMSYGVKGGMKPKRTPSLTSWSPTHPHWRAEKAGPD